jgi:DNA-binding response OmpR family regulator
VGSIEAYAEVPRARERARRPPILVVDDDFSIRRTIAEVLIEEGYDVSCAADGREALALLGDRRSRPGLIILDLWMPSMDGIDFRCIQKTLASVSDIPVLVITASRFLPRELRDLGLEHVLRKPLQLEELLASIRHLVGR